MAAGVRRIEAVSGPCVIDLLTQREGTVKELAGTLRVPPDEVAGRVVTLQEDLRAAQKETAGPYTCPVVHLWAAP